MKYGREYAEAWIKHANSGISSFRQEHLYPFMSRSLKGLGKGARVLDVGCGWGMALEYLDRNAAYVGVDPDFEFFSYIRETLKENDPDRRADLIQGSLPDIPVRDGSFDTVLCSMVLHCVGKDELEPSIRTLFDKSKKGGRVVIVDFADCGEKILREENFVRVDEDSGDYLRGLFRFASGVEMEGMEIHFHKEHEIQKEIYRRGGFSKSKIGRLSVGYVCR